MFMMEKSSKKSQPYQRLGVRLRTLRQSQKRSLLEVSGAIEVDVDVLKKFESGEKRPSEELLILFINYFSINEDEAAKLWELANYEEFTDGLTGAAFEPGKQVALVMPMDVRIVYTDLVHVMANDYGIVMNFMQTAGPASQALAVARVGMSHEHAKSIVELLNKTLESSTKNAKMISQAKPTSDKTKS
jgi:transcriptional regulator with XRE-family HTH domain